MSLNKEKAKEIKRELWNGRRQQALAFQFGVTQASVSRIETGRSWASVEWPDGSKGALPEARRKELEDVHKIESAMPRDPRDVNPLLEMLSKEVIVAQEKARDHMEGVLRQVAKRKDQKDK